MNLDKQKAFIVHVLYYSMILALVYIVIKYILPLLMPFVIGAILALSFRRLIDLIEAKAHIKRAFVSIFILLVFYGIIGFFAFLIGFKIINSIGELFIKLPTLYKDSLLPALQTSINQLNNYFPGMESALEDFMNNIDKSIFTFLTNASSTIALTVTGIAGQLPSILIKLIFTIVSSFFFTIDYYKIADFLMQQFKGERREMMLKLKNNGLGTLGKFIRAYGAIISITFVELSVGFWIIGITNPLLIGLLVAIIDIMPILGTGAVLLPWSLIAFITGDIKVGIGMFVLYIIITAVRQTIEPKIVGQQIGLHPIVTLLLMFVGAQLMGVLGLLLLPVLATLLLKLNSEGTIHILRK
jgi:sporulation integral membrane protein YtvI